MTAKAVYFEDVGVKPWGSINELHDISYRTLTIVTRSEKDMVNLLFSVFSILGGMFCNIYRWYTITTPFTGNKIQLIKMKKELSKNVPGCENTYLNESSINGIWCNTTELKLPFKKENFDYMCGGRNTILAITDKDIGDSKNVWNMLSESPEGYDDNAIHKLLKKHNNIVLAQFHSNTETHTAFQLFGSSKYIKDIEKQLISVRIKAIKKRDEVVNFINSE